MKITGNYRQIEYTVGDSDQLTVIEIMRNQLNISSRLLRKLKKSNDVSVNNHHISFNAKTRRGDHLVITMREDEHWVHPENIPIQVVYEDCDLLIINKVSNIVSHPTAGHPVGTLSNAVRHYALEKGEDYKPRLVNRLDRDTTGIIIFAKNPYAQHIVSEAIKGGQIEKYYTALVHGNVQKDKGTIDLPIGLAEDSIIVRAVNDNGKRAVTHFEVVERYQNATQLNIKIDTGRTHQIRVHFAHINHPLIGDTLYGSFERVAIKRQALHACKMVLKTPRNGTVTIDAPLPDDVNQAIQILA